MHYGLRRPRPPAAGMCQASRTWEAAPPEGWQTSAGWAPVCCWAPGGGRTTGGIIVTPVGALAAARGGTKAVISPPAGCGCLPEDVCSCAMTSDAAVGDLRGVEACKKKSACAVMSTVKSSHVMPQADACVKGCHHCGTIFPILWPAEKFYAQPQCHHNMPGIATTAGHILPLHLDKGCQQAHSRG
jgi:hypothetical protein